MGSKTQPQIGRFLICISSSLVAVEVENYLHETTMEKIQAEHGRAFGDDRMMMVMNGDWYCRCIMTYHCYIIITIIRIATISIF